MSQTRLTRSQRGYRVINRIDALPVEGTPSPELPPYLRRPLTRDEYDASRYLAEHLDEHEEPPANPLIQSIINSRDPNARFTKDIVPAMYKGLFTHGQHSFPTGTRRLCGLSTFPNGDECTAALRFARELVVLEHGDPDRIPNSQEITRARIAGIEVPELGYLMPSVGSITSHCGGRGTPWAQVIVNTIGATHDQLQEYLNRHADLDDLIADYKAVSAWVNRNNKGAPIIVTQGHIDAYMETCGGLGFKKYYQVLKRYPQESINTIRTKAQTEINPITAKRVNRRNTVRWTKELVFDGIQAAMDFDGGRFPTGQRLAELSTIQTDWMNNHRGSLAGIVLAPNIPVPSCTQVTKGVEDLRGMTRITAAFENARHQIAPLSVEQTRRMANVVEMKGRETFALEEIPYLVRVELGISHPTTTMKGN